MRLRRYTLRPRQHPATGREAQLEDLLARVLRQYRQAVATDTLEHPCPSCATDVAIFQRKAEDLGVCVASPRKER